MAGLIATPVVKIKRLEKKPVKLVEGLPEKKEQSTHPVDQHLGHVANVASMERNQKLARKDSYYEN